MHKATPANTASAHHRVAASSCSTTCSHLTKIRNKTIDILYLQVEVVGWGRVEVEGREEEGEVGWEVVEATCR
jgi:hypothetical protein